MTAIADTSFVVATFINTEVEHQRCKLIYQQQHLIMLPQTILAETSYYLTKHRAIGQW